MTPPAASSPRVALEHATSDVVDAWARLATEVEARPFSHPGWHEAWTRAFGRGDSRLLVARRGSRLVGVLPLRRRPLGLRSPANWHTPELALVAEDEPARRALLTALFRQGATTVTLDFVIEGSPEHAALVSCAGRSQLAQRTLQRSPYVDTSVAWETIEAGFSRNRRKGLNRQRRRLVEQAEVDFELHPGEDGLDDLLADIFRVEASGWKGEKGTAIASSPTTRRFYEDVARWAAKQGWLRIALLRLDGRVAAFELCIGAYGVLYALKSGYDAAHRPLGPGILLTGDVLQHACASHWTRYEALGTDESYKMIWASTVHTKLRVQGFSPGMAGTASRLAVVHGRPIAKRGLDAIRAAKATLRPHSGRVP